jgi:predicted nuclease of predicted toxin-antitoxin system
MGTLASALRPFTSGQGSPRIYADANVPARVVEYMRRELGWDVLFVLEHTELRRARDRDHFVHALALNRTIVTLDHDFCDDRAFPPPLSPGVIVCSAADDRMLLRLLTHADATLRGTSENGDLPLRGRKLLLDPSVLEE